MNNKTDQVSANLQRICHLLNQRGIEVTPLQVERAVDSDSDGDPHIAASMVLSIANDQLALERFAMTFTARQKVVYIQPLRPSIREKVPVILISFLFGGIVSLCLLTVLHFLLN